MNLVSVIIPTYNRPDLLYRTLTSIEGQTYPRIEAIIVNDAGQDAREVVAQFPGARYHSHPENRGLAATRNSGIKLASGKYLCYLDDDDFFYPDHVDTLVNELENSDYSVAYTDAHRMSSDGKKEIRYSIDYDYETLRHRNITPVLCVMHERSILDEVGLFDESLDSHEDWDLWLRIGKLYPMKHIAKVTCCYTVGHGDEMSNNYTRMMQTYHAVMGRYR